jgi:hypothetical protein
MNSLPYIKGELDGGPIRFRLRCVLREEQEETRLLRDYLVASSRQPGFPSMIVLTVHKFAWQNLPTTAQVSRRAYLTVVALPTSRIALSDNAIPP